jgi:hypothetical protein
VKRGFSYLRWRHERAPGEQASRVSSHEVSNLLELVLERPLAVAAHSVDVQLIAVRTNGHLCSNPRTDAHTHAQRAPIDISKRDPTGWLSGVRLAEARRGRNTKQARTRTGALFVEGVARDAGAVFRAKLDDIGGRHFLWAIF